MNTFLQKWNTEVEVEPPVPSQRKLLGVSDELVELVWQNGEVVVLSQTQRKPAYSTPNNELDSWIHCPIDESFEKKFLSDLSPKIPSSNPDEAKKLSGQFEDVDLFEYGSSDVNNISPGSEQPDFAPISLPPPRFETFNASNQHHNLGGTTKTGNLELPVQRQGCNQTACDEICKCSAMAVGPSHCWCNQVFEMSSRILSAGVDKNCARKVDPWSENAEQETPEQSNTSLGGSPTSCWITEMHSSDNYRQKRKIEDVEKTECRSDATESESAARYRSPPKCRRPCRSRVAEVHNLSEGRWRDRINEKRRELQELISHSNKLGKASMLDDTIRYVKSLQLQLQVLVSHKQRQS